MSEDSPLQIKTILNKRYPLKSHVYESVREETRQGSPALLVKIRARKNGVKSCSNCGSRVCAGYDTLGRREVEFISILGQKVFFDYAPRRVACPDCGPTVEALPWVSGKSPVSVPLMLQLSFWSRLLSYTEVGRTFGVSYRQVFTAVEYVVNWGLAHRNLSGITAIGVDEIQVRMGHTYLTLVYQIDAHCRRLLWAGEKRTEATLLEFFERFEAILPGIKYVCSDMWRGYLNAIREALPDAIHILDRFHIVANLNKAMDQVRAEETRQLKAKGYQPHLKGTRWCFLKRKENLTGKQRGVLRETLKYNLRSVRAFLLKEDFQRLWSYKRVPWAERFLEQWCKRAMYSRIKPLKQFAKSMRRHKPLIMNYFRARGALSSGSVEGMNNLAKLAIRKSFGFKSDYVLKTTLYHQIGRLPEPALTHRLW